MGKNYIIQKTEELIESGNEPEYESLSIGDFITEFDYATKYASKHASEFKDLFDKRNSRRDRSGGGCVSV